MLIDPQYKYSDLTAKVIQSAMAVHKFLGSGFQELIYQRALVIEFQKNGISFVREQEMSILYNNIEIGTRRVDFFIEGKIMLEIKALAKLEPVHFAQALNYLEAYHLEIGLLINFGAPRLEVKRLINSN